MGIIGRQKRCFGLARTTMGNKGLTYSCPKVARVRGFTFVSHSYPVPLFPLLSSMFTSYPMMGLPSGMSKTESPCRAQPVSCLVALAIFQKFSFFSNPFVALTTVLGGCLWTIQVFGHPWGSMYGPVGPCK